MTGSRLPRDVNGAAVASISVAASTAGRSPRVPDGSTAGGWSSGGCQ